jgi:quercetin dioxygenase-like cupin family protein
MSELAHIPSREDIERLQASMRSLPQVTLETKHHFADGMYCRELFRPAGTTIVGKVHRREHFYIVLSGDVTVVGEGGTTRLKAPCILVSPPGTKRAVYAHEDSTCITVHRTDETDLDAIERELIEPDETALFDAHNQLKGLLK